MDARSLRDLVAARADEYLAELGPDAVSERVDLATGRQRGRGPVRATVPFVRVGRRAPRACPGPGERQLGDLVIGRRRGDGGPRVLLVGHTDTVFDDGTAAARPFRIEGSRARGPGVSDMKAGLLTGFFALRAAGRRRRGVRTRHVRVQSGRGDRLPGLRTNRRGACTGSRRWVRAGGGAGERRHRLCPQGDHRLLADRARPGGPCGRRAREGAQRDRGGGHAGG